MGAPRKQRKKYSTPKHPWERERIDEERKLIEEYGLTNKKEIWKTNSELEKYKRQVKKLIAAKGEQAKKEEELLMKKLKKLKLVDKNAHKENVLDLSIKNLMERRLQTQILRKGLARTINQARQMVVHGHVTINERKVNVPSYIVDEKEEDKIKFYPGSPFANINHAERVKEKAKPEAKEDGEEAS